MYLIVVGAGPVGASLVELAFKDGHNVAVIEQNEQRAKEVSQKYDVLVIHADIAKDKILDEAGAEQADALVATTSDDSANLMAMFLGVECGIKTLISVVNESGHRSMFERLGAYVLLDPEAIVARHLYGVLSQPRVEDVAALPSGAQVVEITVSNGVPVVGKTLAEAGKDGLFPRELLVISIKRGEEMLIPSGKTALQAGDHLTLFSLGPLDKKTLKAFTG